MYVRQSRASRSRCSIPGTLVPGTVHAGTQHITNQRYRGGSTSRVKTPCEQELPHCTYVRATSRATPASCDGEGEEQFPHEMWTHCEALPCVEPAVHAMVRSEEFPLICPTPKVMPRFSLGDVGEARWPLSHRWTDTSLTSSVP